MSLLMQALKKAERAKQASLHEDELEKPSEAYDQVLELAPADSMTPTRAAAPPQAPVAPSSLSLEPLSGASSEPWQPSPAPAAASLPAAAEPAVARPVPPPAAAAAGTTASTSAGTAANTAAGAASTHSAASGAQGASRARTEAPKAGKARSSQAGSSSRSNTPPRGPISVDPATLRLAVLLGALLLVVAAMAYWYWRASSSPGAGANLPGVPMPLTDAPGATASTGPVVVLPANGGPAQLAVPAAAELPAAAPRRDEPEGASMAQQQAMIQAAVQAAVQAQLAQMPPPAPPALPPVVAPDSSQIQVVRNDAAAQIAPGVQQAYQAMNAGQIAPARQQYETVLQQDPNNRDALLALAALAQREQQGAQAAALYVRLLELNPDDGVALAGLVGLRQGDQVQSESRLKAILARTPDSGPVLFALGNVYAQQRRWSEAQQQFFRAYSAAPGNADYAFNLAVGLDRLNQPKLAATYYQRALLLAQTTPSAFDRASAQQRLGELGGATGSTSPGIVIIKE